MSEDIELPRQGSICYPSVQQQLLTAFLTNDKDTFENILSNKNPNTYDIDHSYGDPHYGSLLFLACNQGKYDFVQILLENGANRNLENEMYRMYPIHIIFQKGSDENIRHKILELLMKVEIKNHKKTSSHEKSNTNELDVNVRDRRGNTALHLAAEKNCIESIKLLLENKKTDVNGANRKYETVLHILLYSLLKESKQTFVTKKLTVLKLIRMLIENVNFKFPNIKDQNEKTITDLTKEIMDYDLNNLLNPKIQDTNDKISPDELMLLLQNDEDEEFLENLEKNTEYLNWTNGYVTFLMYGCEFGKEKVVNKLIELKANVNVTSTGSIKKDKPSDNTAIMIAANKGYINIVNKLLDVKEIDVSPVNKTNIFHQVINGSVAGPLLGESNSENVSTAEKNHFKCLEVLVKHKECKCYINSGDILGNTALHYAAKVSNDQMVLLLLKEGAYAAVCNKYGEPAMANISPNILEQFLDECVNPNKRLPQEMEYEITLKYTFFIPPMLNLRHDDTEGNKSERYPLNYETEPLVFMSKYEEMSHLLKHPVITSFLYIKWNKIQHLFYINLLFYVIFMSLFTCYILGNCGSQGTLPQTVQNQTDNGLFDNKDKHTSLWVGSTIFLAVLLVRELIQLLISPKYYLSKGENWLEMFIIVVTVAVLFYPPYQPHGNRIAAFGILFTWAELVLLIGRHPKLSTYIAMLRTVTISFFKFLLWYSILIIAFALSFYTLFSNANNDEDFFDDPGISVFKTVVMLTGEFELGSIQFSEHPGFSHILFVLFIFMIAIVLFNLLNGLAISDTQMIKSDAEVVGYKSQINLISYVETMLYQSSLWGTMESKVRSLCCCIPPYRNSDDRKTLFGRCFSVNIFTELSDKESSFENCQVIVSPNKNNIVRIQQNSTKENELYPHPKNCKIFRMKGTIVRSAKGIIKKKESSETALKTLEKRVQDLDKQLNSLKNEFSQKLDEILKTVKN